ncbi:MAG: HAD family hydrolase [Clostridia bacterium]|nr:HAD family hydrolase [Clostridia bacterium]
MIKAVLFDLDGTLADSLIDLADGVNRAIAQKGFPTHEVEAFKYFVGDGIPKMIERALPQEHRDSDTINEIKDIFLPYYALHYADNTYAYEGMPELVNTLKSKGFIVAVVTNKEQHMANEVVTSLYSDVFDLIFGKRDGIPAKPDPTAALMAMEELGVKPEECVFIGDSGMDVATAVNSGAVPVGELWGFRKEDELLANGAKYIIRKPQELLTIIEELNK